MGPKIKGQNNDDMYHVNYPKFSHIHVMVFIGFGFLWTFLRRYGMAGVGLNLILACVAIQWAMLLNEFFFVWANQRDNPCDAILNKTAEPKPSKNIILLDLPDMMEADFTAAAVLISFGAVIGVASPLQLLVMVIFEVVLLCLNQWLSEII